MPIGTTAAVLVGLVAGTALVVYAGHRPTLREFHKPVPRLVVDRPVSRVVLPSSLAQDAQWNHVAMGSFIVVAQRLGYMPVISDDFITGLLARRSSHRERPTANGSSV